MQNIIGFLVLILAYIIGSIPFGLLIVKLSTGQDVRKIQSGFARAYASWILFGAVLAFLFYYLTG